MVGAPEPHVWQGGQILEDKSEGGESRETVTAASGSRVGDGGGRMGWVEIDLEISSGNQAMEAGAGVSPAEGERGDDSAGVGGRDVGGAVGAARGQETAGGGTGEGLRVLGPRLVPGVEVRGKLGTMWREIGGTRATRSFSS